MLKNLKEKYNVTEIEIEHRRKEQMKFEMKNKINEMKIFMDKIYSNQTLQKISINLKT